MCILLPKLYGSPEHDERQQSLSLFLLVDGDSGRHADSIKAVMDLFQAQLRPQDSLRIAIFDKEPDGRATKPLPINSPLLPLLPRTPLKDALEVCLGNIDLYATKSLKVAVILVHEESYRSWVSTKELQDLAKKWNVRIYAITLNDTEQKHNNFIHRIGTALAAATVWVLDGLADGSAPSHHSTTNMLKTLSASSGGKVCCAGDNSEAIDCADHIYSEIDHLAE